MKARSESVFQIGLTMFPKEGIKGATSSVTTVVSPSLEYEQFEQFSQFPWGIYQLMAAVFCDVMENA